jgi:hypothetical protein
VVAWLSLGAVAVGVGSGCMNLPKVSETGTPVSVAPGGKIVWRLPEKSVAPGVVVTARGSDARTYTVIATLGDQPITITVPVHDD